MKTKEELIELFENRLKDLRENPDKYSDYVTFENYRTDESAEYDAAFITFLNTDEITEDEIKTLCLSLIPKVDFHYEFINPEEDEVISLDEIEDYSDIVIHSWVGDNYCCQIPYTYLCVILDLDYNCEDCYSIPGCTHEKLVDFIKQVEEQIKSVD